MKSKLLNRNTLIHAISWGILIALPLLFSNQSGSTWTESWHRFVRTLGNPIGYMLVFYINYLLLVPKLYFKRKFTAFALANIVVIFVAMLVMILWWKYAGVIFPDIEHHMPRDNRHKPWPMYFNFILMLTLFAGLALATRLAGRWHQLEEARKDAERERTEAELSNLRNQLNPHFLLNTLNNIYALTAFDPPRAQTAVGELSKLLRHMLYDNRQNYVALYKEAEFINNYVELMKIRLTDAVTLDTHINIERDDATPIAPLIFISLIENAFKHGISQAGVGHIALTLDHDKKDSAIRFEIRNSNYPKRDNDKSGSGIGLEQVARRLELMYPGQYQWERGVNKEKNEYFSIITLHYNEQLDPELRDN